ncbi:MULTISPECIES: ThiF family adenylyltransferase [unclassified Colwellia]|jgi:hypothetical protein|uniref:ThiF family adenylyltransferase n=1 Tax=unclassified Colwellia TaxID=196834 RepID=UPI0015F50DC1|nr:MULTISPECIES: ThiF family adenylyltransferase [unclassified Colwellia]MBA6256449.1 ThiF family adenylyltransferase [Colwellia sp. MB3u-28]MBA6260348.1 ThiF family adenylyltransferase [Colwellia sp. MB3u-41]
MVDIDELVEHLCSRDFNCQKSPINLFKIISVKLTISGKPIELIHLLTDEITGLPVFSLFSPNDSGQLAHVSIFDFNGLDLGSICVNDRDSVSVNFSMPLLAIEESLRRHIDILTKGITDPEWNRHELLREFSSNWLGVCDLKNKRMLLTSASGKLEEIDVLRPLPNNNHGVNSYHLAQSQDSDLSAIASLHWNNNKSKRTLAGKAIIIPLIAVEPAPLTKEELKNWYLNTLINIEPENKQLLNEQYGRWSSREYWIIFNVDVPSGKTWFCLHFQANKKHSLPLTTEQMKHWKIKAIPLRLFNKENVLPRGGANLDLSYRRVALIGAGSVGGEIAQKLSSAGIQNLDIFDPDYYSIDNLYRHVLPEEFLELSKAHGLGWQLQRQFLWSKAKGSSRKLLSLRNRQELMSYDLIIVAIGSPTHERLFKEYLIENDVDVPVINTWLEGFGVGGHATLDIPASKGCLLCAYVCQETLARGLNSNLNFIEANQNVTINLAGCGEQFISYGALCSAQTGIMASDLAIKFLEEKIITSSKVSWKGSDYDANDNSIQLTHRYHQFSDSLQIKPLHDEDCDACS